jgi:hypothetical protein
MDVESNAVKDACVDMLKGGQRQMRYRLKKKYFTGVPANQVRTTSPVSCMTDDQWRELVQMWSSPNHKVFAIKLHLSLYINNIFIYEVFGMQLFFFLGKLFFVSTI